MEVTFTIRLRDEERRVRLDSEPLTIGRGEAADVQLDDDGLSRVHSRFARRGDSIWVFDEGSTNGTFVDGEPIGARGVRLANGDQIAIGDATTIAVTIERAAATPGLAFRRPLAATLALALVAAGSVAIAVRSDDNGPNPVAEPVRVVRPTPVAPASTTSVPTVVPPVATVSTAPIPESDPAPIAARPRKLYLQMSEQEQIEFVAREARRISMMMGKRPYEFTDDVTLIVKKYLDGYARRSRSSVEGTTWGDGLPALYGRAGRYAPLINRAFRARGMHPVVGLYIAMIETEYHECLRSPVGALGMFQFMAATAQTYGVSPDDRCNVPLMAPVCAHYMADRIAQFGGDSLSVALAIASYNRGEAGIASDLRKVVGSGNPERSFWTLVANSEKLPPGFQNENIKYVPKFFAAAIVGENPWAFGLDLQPLSSITDAGDSASK